MTAPIIVNAVDGHPVCAGPADTIQAALRGAQPLTITGKHATGDTVYLAPRDGADIARTVPHPVHGDIHYAWVDTARMGDAPQLSELYRDRAAQGRIAAMQAEDRGRAMVPACDNCGECSRCV
ncbi:hypothetical protein BDK92_7229 [Micromonospora pisi]|uniref:Uncharacterized protein n=1 Tax=Micromonospora pisi TaxID=589240 RepID=A0A495JUT3_9ACTN|nr:hypothetical protein [Micromonospora pisi]RKR92750.1 hypothetical protein BDK92_7229 [Micromonospora pisi]